MRERRALGYISIYLNMYIGGGLVPAIGIVPFFLKNLKIQGIFIETPLYNVQYM